MYMYGMSYRVWINRENWRSLPCTRPSCYSVFIYATATAGALRIEDKYMQQQIEY